MTFTDNIMILYRGSLKSCNYHCSYCPFSKHMGSGKEYERDRQQWNRFVDSVLERTAFGVRALMVVPYGEALIHSWYWEGLGRLAESGHMEAVGAQTNLSFPLDSSLKNYREAGGKTEKLRLWATFHPEMISAESFAERCRQLLSQGVSLCAGVVGVPEQIEDIRRLRALLPAEIYLWINKMDGLKRPYTQEEKAWFKEMDPFFERELLLVKTDPEKCMGRLFVEGDGKIRRCNISPVREENWYDSWESIRDEILICSRKRCSCYLAYGGRSDVMNGMLFGDYPLFRIPRKAKALFLDIDGTLIPAVDGSCEDGRERVQEGRIPTHTRLDLELAKNLGTKLFFATARPYEDAKRKCKDIWHLFEGGVFGGGGYIRWEKEGSIQERIYPIREKDCLALDLLGKELQSRVLVYRRGERVYKVTFWRRGKRSWKGEELQKTEGRILFLCENRVRVMAEGPYLEIRAVEASKAQGVKVLCGWIGISPKEGAAAGDSLEDEGMIRLCRGINDEGEH